MGVTRPTKARQTGTYPSLRSGGVPVAEVGGSVVKGPDWCICCCMPDCSSALLEVATAPWKGPPGGVPPAKRPLEA